MTEDSPWAVSLRDVDRFCKLLVYFNDNSIQPDVGVWKVAANKRNQPKHKKRDIALVLAIYFCYVIRMGEQLKRDGVIKFVSNVQQPGMTTKKKKCLQIDRFKDIVKREQERFLDKMEIKAGIGRNYPLTENIFVIITCILNQIPLIVTGKPGSSKTLAMNLILKSFKGKISSSEFFKSYPNFLNYNFQGSEQSTSKGIEKIYKKAAEEQYKKNRKDT